MKKTTTFHDFLAQLSSLSEEAFIDPREFRWPASVDADGWFFSPELISIYGTDAWESLDEPRRKRLSFFEAVNFFSLNIHGEKYLISEIARHLYQSDGDRELSHYLTHFVDEETRHMQYFANFCRRYAGKIYPDRSVHDLADGSGDELFVLFARINAFEEIVDHYNRVMAKDVRLDPVVREINRIHHVEELRHLAFGRRFLEHYLEAHSELWTDGRVDAIRDHVSGYVDLVWKQYYNPDVYRDAGVEAPFETWRDAVNSAPSRSHREQVGRCRLSWLRKLDLLEAA